MDYFGPLVFLSEIEKNLKNINACYDHLRSFCSPWLTYEEVVYDAVSNNNLELLTTLVEDLGASVTDNHNDAIIVAVNVENLDIIKYLVKRGADPSARNNYAIRNCQNLSIVKFLVEECRVDPQARNNDAIRQASFYRNYELCRYLVEKCGAPIKYVDTTTRAYMAFCKKMDEKKKERAQKKIYFWWIQICYNLEHHSGCGKRMAQKNLDVFESMMRV